MILPRTNPPWEGNHPFFGKHNKNFGLSAGAIAAIVIAVVIIVGLAAWIIHTLLRARKLGLPPPTWRTFVPFVNKGKGSYEPTRPRTGGLFGFLKPARGGYTGAQTRADRTRGAFDDQAWDARMEGEDELEYRGAPQGVKDTVTGVLPRGREQDLGAGMEQERGRSRSREPVYPIDEYTPPPGESYGRRTAEVYHPQGQNPFDQDVHGQTKKDGFDAVRIQGGRMSTDSERRSVFREGI
ncbi:hypothetical protein K440DRAFT_601492 [Wilcoxina mikolae CBS 423.85]|nr:hypothetical protein K440DRAFT_601492 [Wilcoxina mikolae CBS 423.85]